MSPPYYHFTVRNVNKLINEALKQKELVKAKKKIDSLCKKMSYRLVKTCNDCSEVTPEELFSISKGNYKEFRKILSSSPKKKKQKIKKLLKEAFLGVVTCSHYAKQKWFEERKEGLIFSQEFYIKLANKSMIVEQPLNLSLGIMECHGYGNLDGSEEEILYEECRDKLGVPRDVIIVDLPQFIEKLKFS